jgi:hypothetical protein
VSKRYAVLRCATVTLCTLLAASVLAVTPVKAADTAPTDLRGQKPVAQPAQGTAVAPAAKPKPAKKAKLIRTIEEQRVIDGLWTRQTNWLSMRAGYAKGGGSVAGGALVGYGIAYQRMLDGHWGIGGSVQHDLLGHLGNAYEISVPMTLEATRHFRWPTSLRPYVGLGAGYYFHKYYRTAGRYTGSPGFGKYVALGANLPVDQRHLLGLDARMSFVNGSEGTVNPVFGVEKASSTLLSIKLNWAFTY